MPDHNYFANLLWQIADLLRGPYRPPQYERVMLPMTVLRRFDCVLAPTKAKVLAEFDRRKSRFEGEAPLESWLNRAAGQRFHNRSRLDFGKLKGDPDNIERHLIGYIHGFSKNVRDIFEFFEFEGEIEKMRESNIPLPRGLEVRRHRPAPPSRPQRADGAHLREPDPPLQRAGQRDGG